MRKETKGKWGKGGEIAGANQAQVSDPVTNCHYHVELLTPDFKLKEINPWAADDPGGQARVLSCGQLRPVLTCEEWS
ncbi:hypothetical protein RRG08_002726 [Elysia crispata]|uniref:Uncharacterized protein n=1 Tax=Elysia crispata TaxID=231223 RepID=A0AAE0XUF4_9GAST|nr:hypothetical protein RRG08_002726 [Elysia crispata]